MNVDVFAQPTRFLIIVRFLCGKPSAMILGCQMLDYLLNFQDSSSSVDQKLCARSPYRQTHSRKDADQMSNCQVAPKDYHRLACPAAAAAAGSRHPY